MSIFSQSDVGPFRSDRLARAKATYFPKAELSDGYLLGQLQAAENEIALRLKVCLEATTVFPFTPTQAQITALNNAPYVEEPGYDYDSGFFQDDRWGYIVTRRRPVISVIALNLVYPNPLTTVYEIPNDWIRLDKKYGHIRLVPASSTFVAPLGAFIMQAIGGGGTIPGMIQLQYVTGYQDVKAEMPAIVNVIYRLALLNIIEENFEPSSQSISADGLSQSISWDPQKQRDLIEETLFGPKGANGGLFTAIHGLSATVGGVLA